MTLRRVLLCVSLAWAHSALDERSHEAGSALCDPVQQYSGYVSPLTSQLLEGARPAPASRVH